MSDTYLPWFAGYWCSPFNWFSDGKLRRAGVHGLAAYHAIRHILDDRGLTPPCEIEEVHVEPAALVRATGGGIGAFTRAFGLLLEAGILSRTVTGQIMVLESTPKSPAALRQEARRNRLESQASGRDSHATVTRQSRDSHGRSETETEIVGSDHVGRDPSIRASTPSTDSTRCTATLGSGKPCTRPALPDRDVCATHARTAIPEEALEAAGTVLAYHWQVLAPAGLPTLKQRRDLARVMMETGHDAAALCRVVDYLGAAPWNRSPDGTPIARTPSWTYGDADRLQRWLQQAATGTPGAAPGGGGNGHAPAAAAEPDRPTWATARAICRKHFLLTNTPGEPGGPEIGIVDAILASGLLTEDQCYAISRGAILDPYHLGKLPKYPGARLGIRDCFGDIEKARRLAALGEGRRVEDAPGYWEAGS